MVFNATSASLRAELPPVPASVFASCGLAYELAEQAAEAFAWWRGVRPDTRAVIDKLTVPLG